jgi:ribosomal protein S18 acetylase RimI-like enzyme
MELRTMTRDELDVAIEWAAKEGWNPGLDDAQVFFDSDPEGFFVACDNGRMAAAISVVNHTDDFAFLGLYICAPEFRGQGIGYALWQHALEHAGNRTVGLDGVEAQQENYKKSGFVLTGRTERYAGTLTQKGAPEAEPVRASEIEELIELEAYANGFRKSAFLRPWLTDSETRKTLVLHRGGQPAGFVTVRRCREGYKIGPLVAPDKDAASALLSSAASITKGETTMIDIPQDSVGLHELCKSQGMEVSFRTARMYRGNPPEGSAMEYAVSTLELG